MGVRHTSSYAPTPRPLNYTLGVEPSACHYRPASDALMARETPITPTYLETKVKLFQRSCDLGVEQVHALALLESYDHVWIAFFRWNFAHYFSQ